MTEHEDDLCPAFVEHWGAEAHDGPGWYYFAEEYPDEGSVGAFGTREEAETHARAADYRIGNP